MILCDPLSKLTMYSKFSEALIKSGMAGIIRGFSTLESDHGTDN